VSAGKVGPPKATLELEFQDFFPLPCRDQMFWRVTAVKSKELGKGRLNIPL
jgi:hypothetical protein